MSDDEDLMDLGSVTLRKMMTPEGGIFVRADYGDLTIYEVIGMLTAELDAQRALLQEMRD